MRYRHVVREVEGSKCLVKVTTIPKGTRSQGWIGPIGLHNYAIQADLRAAESGVGQPGDPATPAALVAAAVARFGRLDAVIANAGFADRTAAIPAPTPEPVPAEPAE